MPRKRPPLTDLPSDLQITLEATANRDFAILAQEASDDDRNLLKFTMSAYSGGRLHLKEFSYPVVVDLSGLRVPRKSLPILRGHSQDRIVGHTDAITLNSGSIKLTGILSGASADAAEVAASAANGFPWESSIGARAEQMVYVDEGETVEVNARKFTGPLYVARKSVLREVSFVALGADEGGASARVHATATITAGVRGSETTLTGPASASQPGESAMPTFDEWIQAQGFATTSDLSEQALIWLKNAYQKQVVEASGTGNAGNLSPPANPTTPTTPGGTPTAPLGIQAAGGDGAQADADLLAHRRRMANETRRISRIREIMAEYGSLNIEAAGQQVDLESHAIEAGWSAEQVELHALRLARPAAPAGHVGGGRSDLNAQAIEASLLMSVGMPTDIVARGYDEQVMNTATGKVYRGWTLHALMGAVIHAAGHHHHGSYKSNEFIRTSLRADRELRAAGFSSLSLGTILENVAHKALIAAYQGQETVWQHFCAVKSYTDFKVQSRYRLDANGSFKKVAPDGEIKHVGLTDAKFTNQLDTYGAMITLNRQMMINDDLGAFVEIPSFLGHMSVVRVEEAFFTLLLSNPGGFFHAANHGNLLTGTASALSVTALSSAETAFRNQVTPNGKPMLISPERLLVPTTLKITADNIFASELLITGEDTTKPHQNPHAGKYKPYTSPYLNNTAITDQDGNALSGQSNTQWYLFANPAVRAAFCMGFLNGQQLPTIESDETPFNTLGMQWRAFHDFGVGAEDTVGAVKATGVD